MIGLADQQSVAMQEERGLIGSGAVPASYPQPACVMVVRGEQTILGETGHRPPMRAAQHTLEAPRARARA